MNRGKSNLIITVLAIIVLSGSFFNVSGIPKDAAIDPTRENTCWTTGYWNAAFNDNSSLLPWANYPAFGASYFYDTLFGWNSIDGSYIPCLGESIEWIDNVIIIKLWDEAKWTGPGVDQGIINKDGNDNITAADVIYSFQLLNGTKWGNFYERIQLISQGATTKHVVFTLKDSFSYSARVKQWLTSDIPIVCKVVWEDIASTYNANLIEGRVNHTVFRNRWDDLVQCPVKWHIASGPYLQTGNSEDMGYREIYIKNDEWWGQGLLYRDIMGLSADKALNSPTKAENIHPSYIGIKFYFGGGDSAISSIISGLIDQSSIGIPKFKDFQTDENDPNDYFHLWYADEDVRSYTALGSQIELVFNTNRFPMSEHWFREAISKAIDYAPISTVAAANNWIRGSPTYLNTKYNSEHLAVFDQSIHDEYMFEYNASAARKLFEDAGAYEKEVDYKLFEDNGAYEQEVYTKNKWYIDAPMQARVPLATQYNESLIIDADPDKVGVQMEIGPFDIPTPMGWTDTTIAVDLWAKSISESLDIQIEKNETSWDRWNDSISNAEFDLAMWTYGPATLNGPYQMFDSLVQPQSINGNASSWRGINAQKFTQALAIYEISDDLITQKTQASIMQRAYAEDLPTISSHINCLWYQYSTQYWKGWNNDGWQYNQPCTTYTTDHIVLKQRLLLALAPASSDWNPPANFNILTEWPEGEGPWESPGGITWSGIPVMLIFGSLGTVIIVQKRRT